MIFAILLIYKMVFFLLIIPGILKNIEEVVDSILKKLLVYYIEDL